MKHYEKWYGELSHLSIFGWAMLFSCPVLGRMFNIFPSTGHGNNIDEHLPSTGHENNIDDHLPSTGHENNIDDHLPSTGHENNIDEHLPSTGHENNIDEHSSKHWTWKQHRWTFFQALDMKTT